ncbi:MAG TPA: response regulator [Candidatus Paceibacterota bacterium]
MRKILLIEDDQFLSSLLHNRIQKEGFEVELVKDGGAALAALKKSQPDLILLDLILPGKSGFEVMEDIKADPQIPKTPIIIISNLGQDSDIARGKELGATDYLVKANISIDFLIGKVKEILN